MFLSVTSNPIFVDIESYTQQSDTVRGVIIKDCYSHSGNRMDHGQYRLIIESPTIRDESDLNRYNSQIRLIVQRLTLLTKCVLGESLNVSPWETDTFTKRIEKIGQMPNGWSTNYTDVQKELDKKKGMSVHIEVVPHHYFVLNNSPFRDYMRALKQYSRLSPAMIDLLRLVNDADLVASTGRYMLLSKALEIVNALFPLQKRKDDRIQTLFPDLADRFNGTTLKDLMNLANNRKETRHYVGVATDTLSHPAMSEDELKRFYSLSNNLCLNIIRSSLSLEIVDFC